MIRLSQDTTETIETIGGKAMGLLRLLRADLPVPEAWAIPAQVSADPEARTTCLDDLATWWAEMSTTPGENSETLWAVRSSAVAEDLDGASFAGVYETVLGISDLASLRTGVEKCWAAYDADRAHVYRGELGNDQSTGGIALVLQRMIEPEAAGVMLTTNPRRAFADEIVVDASWGLGEAVVSGAVDPDHFVIERSTGMLRESRIATKQVEHIYDGSAVVERAVDDDRQGEPSIDTRTLHALHTLATHITAAIGPGRDIEWAVGDGTVWVLQDRPITTLAPTEPENVWSRLWGDEYKSEYTLPLSAGLMSSWMDNPLFVESLRLQHRRDLATRSPFKLYNGYMYFDGQFALQMAEAFPKSMREGIFGAWFTPLWLDKIVAAPWHPRMTLNMALAARRDPGRGGQKANLAAMQAHCRRIEEQIVPLRSQDFTALDIVEWRRQLDLVQDLGIEHFRILRWGMAVHNTILHGILHDLLAKWADDSDGQLYCSLISGLPGTRTAEINAEIYDLASAARTNPVFAERLRDTQDWRALREETPGELFWDELEEFLARHGHRAATRDAASPRWRERPDVIIGFVHAQLVGNGDDPRRNEAHTAATREASTREAIARARRGPGGRLRAGILSSICARTQTFTVYRENQRYHLDHLIEHQRLLVLEQGRRLVESGQLAEPDDVFFLTEDEFFGAISLWRNDSPIPTPDELAGRRQHFLTYRTRMPATFLFDDVQTEGEIVEGDPQPTGDADGFIGIGAARGTASGTTFCVDEIEQLSQVHPGDILVAKNIDPGWTSVFPMLGGLITETGGILSHGAILAREYGIPTVTGIADATTLFATGTKVGIDGTAGVVTRIDDAPATP